MVTKAKFNVCENRQVSKSVTELPAEAHNQYRKLNEAIQEKGPVRGEFKNYGKLWKISKWLHHCHLCGGKTTYVAVWKEMNHYVQMVYVGTHENAPY